MNAKNILVRLLGGENEPKEFQKALEFINGIAYRHHKCAPPPPPSILIGAYFGEEIVGTTGLEFRDAETLFPIEENWRFEKGAAPFPFKRENIAQIGRWMAVKPGIASALLYVASTFCLANDRYYFLAEAKPKIIKILENSGQTAYPIKGARLTLDRIPQGGLGYYIADPPALYMFDLKYMVQAALRNIRPPKSLSFVFPDFS